MNAFVIPLERVRQTDAARVGAKAATLGTLRAAGFPVPSGLCVTTGAFRLALALWREQIDALIQRHDLHDPAGAVAAADRIAGLLADPDFRVPEAVMTALRAALLSVGDPGTPLAVRSSATAEDGAEASYAGQYRSLIGVRGDDALQDALLAVWRSFYSSHALVARAAHGGLGRDEGMGVLILPVVEAECAGVALSVDPMQGGRQRVVISAAWGLGAGVVDGSVATDTAWVRRDGATEGFELEEWRVVEQAQQMVLGPDGGLTPAPLPAERRRAASLPVSWLERVAQFCVAAEVLFGAPQDVEWAIADGQVWVLQSRPITALPPELSSTARFPVTWADKAERRLAWVHYAYWRHVLRPLEVDYALDREAAQKESSQATGGQRYWRVKLANGRIYVAWAPNDLTPGERRVRRAALTDLKARLRRQDVTTWEHWGPEIIQATGRLSAFDFHNADGPRLADHLEEARGAMRRHMTIHGAPISVPYQPLYDAYAALSGLEGAAVADAADQLLEGQETTTTRLIDGLYALALSARQLPAVAALVADPPPDVGERLAALPQAAVFRRQLEDFLTAFGDRMGLGYGSDATIAVPSWREDPALVLRSAAPYLDPAVEAPAVARARAQSERQARIEALCEGCDDPQAVAEFRRQLAYARRAAVVMEEHNHYIDQLMNGQLRRAILAAARWLMARGVLESQEQVFWLHYDEILSALRADAPQAWADPLADAISARRAQHAAWEQLVPPPLLGTPEAALPPRPPLQDDVTPLAAQRNGRVSGLGASPGLQRGRARIVRPEVLLPDLAPGEVLVAENMGPRWTPLLPTLGGLVLDGGALGQHHAIAAREYGVPAVVGTRNATERIPDGAWVVVDGTAGTVEIESA